MLVYVLVINHEMNKCFYHIWNTLKNKDFLEN